MARIDVLAQPGAQRTPGGEGVGTFAAVSPCRAVERIAQVTVVPGTCSASSARDSRVFAAE